RLERAGEHAEVERHLLEDELEELVDDDEDALLGDRRGGDLRGEELIEAEVGVVAEAEAAVRAGGVDEGAAGVVTEAERLGVLAPIITEGERPPGVLGGHRGRDQVVLKSLYGVFSTSEA